MAKRKRKYTEAKAGTRAGNGCGKRVKKPSLEVLMQMAIVLDTSPDYLLGLTDTPPTKG